MTVTETDSNLVKHALNELKLLGVEEGDIYDVLKVIKAFAEIHPSGAQSSWLIPVIHDLLQFKNLSPLTDNPEEWTEYQGVWQSKRNPEAFSHDGGKKYYLMSETATDPNPWPFHASMPS